MAKVAKSQRYKKKTVDKTSWDSRILDSSLEAEPIHCHKVALNLDVYQADELDRMSKIVNRAKNDLIDTATKDRARLSEMTEELLASMDISDEVFADLEVKLDAERKDIWSRTYSTYGLRDLLPGMKEVHPFLNGVHSSPLKNVALNVINSIKAYRNGKAGFPKFHSWKMEWCSLEFDEKNKGWSYEGNLLTINCGIHTKTEANDPAVIVRGYRKMTVDRKSVV